MVTVRLCWRYSCADSFHIKISFVLSVKSVVIEILQVLIILEYSLILLEVFRWRRRVILVISSSWRLIKVYRVWWWKSRDRMSSIRHFVSVLKIRSIRRKGRSSVSSWMRWRRTMIWILDKNVGKRWKRWVGIWTFRSGWRGIRGSFSPT